MKKNKRSRDCDLPSDILKDVSIDPLQRLLLYLHHPSNPDIHLSLGHGHFQFNGMAFVRFDWIRLQDEKIIWVTHYEEDDTLLPYCDVVVETQPQYSEVITDQTQLQYFLNHCREILDHNSRVDLLKFIH